MTATAADPLRDYYGRRAAEYERVYARPERQHDLLAMQAWLAGWFARRHVLEIACGTGWWTPHAARDCASWLATDISQETLALARRKPLPAGKVRFAQADAYAVESIDEGSFDAAFAAFWWSHVPCARLAAWLDTLHARLEPGARIVFIDNRFVPGSSTPITRTGAHGDTWQQRTLGDGSVHEVLKNFPTREQALGILGPRAREAQWHEWPYYWAITYTLA
jgi:SAM-dependent methyltransferase